MCAPPDPRKTCSRILFSSGTGSSGPGRVPPLPVGLWVSVVVTALIGIGPSAGVEEGDRVKVVPPVGHFAVLDCDDGGEAVVVRSACQRRFTVYLVLEDGHRRFRVPVDAQVVGGVHDHVIVVAAVQVNDVLPPFDAPGVAGDGDDVLDDDIVGQEVEVVLAVGEALQPFPDDAEEGAVGTEVRAVAGVPGHLSSGVVQAAALRRANAAKLAGGRPVTVSTSPVGRDPSPPMMAPVSQRSMTA